MGTDGLKGCTWHSLDGKQNPGDKKGGIFAMEYYTTVKWNATGESRRAKSLLPFRSNQVCGWFVVLCIDVSE